MNRKIVYFYRYARNEKCESKGHAKLVFSENGLDIFLAFSFCMDEVFEGEVYALFENVEGVIYRKKLGDMGFTKDDCNATFMMGDEQIKWMIRCQRIKNIGIVVCSQERDDYLLAKSGNMVIDRESLYGFGFLSEMPDYENHQEEYVKGDQEAEGIAVDTIENINVEEPADVRDSNVITEQVYGSKESEDIDIHITKAEERDELVRNVSQAEGVKDSTGFMVSYESLIRQRVRYNPFTSGKIVECVKLTLQDVILMGDMDNGLKDNSFLFHGYYMYKHILLGKIRVMGQEYYSLLVPGVKNEREIRMADAYGFHGFISLDGQPGGTRFGYYQWLL